MGLFSTNGNKFDKIIDENDTLDNYKKSLAYLTKSIGVTNGNEAIIVQGFLVLHHDLQEIKKTIEDKK